MSTPKEQLRRYAEALPDDAGWEDIEHWIVLRERIARGRREADQETLIEQSEVEVRMKRWLDA